jgi:hypothetical protein
VAMKLLLARSPNTNTALVDLSIEEKTKAVVCANADSRVTGKDMCVCSHLSRAEVEETSMLSRMVYVSIMPLHMAAPKITMDRQTCATRRNPGHPTCLMPCPWTSEHDYQSDVWGSRDLRAMTLERISGFCNTISGTEDLFKHCINGKSVACYVLEQPL